MTVRPLAELADEAARRLTSEQLRAIASRVDAAKLAAEREPSSEPFDLAAGVAFDLDGTVRRAASLWVTGAGVEPDIFGSWYRPQLLRAGVSKLDADDALHRHVGWRSRTVAERERAVARAMMAEGFTPEQIEAALRETEPASC